ncbi:MAG: hypothetical protein U1E77_13905 [Inhella sp.]
MHARHLLPSLGLALCLSGPARADSASLQALAQARDPQRYASAVQLGAEIRATGDNKSFTMWWQPSGWSGKAGVIVPLSGHDGWAHEGIVLWQPYAQKYGYAVLALQWWFGAGEGIDDYYRPEAMYPLLATQLQAKGVRTGSVFFNGFSRGSANSYAMVALDRQAGSGQRYFGLVLSNAGGVATNYPPNQQIVAGSYGAQPFAGMAWAMYCGRKDPDPSVNGCPGMEAARSWVTGYGAQVQLFIDDPNGDHGGFMLNSANVEAALAAYAGVLARTATAFGHAETDCLLNWGEEQYPSLLTPRRAASQVAAPYYYRAYSGSYVGVSATDQHLYFLDAKGVMSDLGLASGWSQQAGCR